MEQLIKCRRADPCRLWYKANGEENAVVVEMGCLSWCQEEPEKLKVSFLGLPIPNGGGCALLGWICRLQQLVAGALLKPAGSPLASVGKKKKHISNDERGKKKLKKARSSLSRSS